MECKYYVYVCVRTCVSYRNESKRNAACIVWKLCCSAFAKRIIYINLLKTILLLSKEIYVVAHGNFTQCSKYVCHIKLNNCSSLSVRFVQNMRCIALLIFISDLLFLYYWIYSSCYSCSFIVLQAKLCYLLFRAVFYLFLSNA